MKLRKAIYGIVIAACVLSVSGFSAASVSADSETAVSQEASGAQAARYYASGGSFYIQDFFGITREQLIDSMYEKENATNWNYYYNTPYTGWSESTALYPSGAPRADGHTGLNCAGFVTCAVGDAAGTLAPLEKWCNRSGADAEWGLTGASVWWNFLANEGIQWRSYTSKADLLNDRWAEMGDIMFYLPTGDVDTHVAFYWGSTPGEDVMWHSLYYRTREDGVWLGNIISGILEADKNIIYIFKWSAPEGSDSLTWSCEDGTWYLKDESGENQTGWAVKNGNWYYLDPLDGAMLTGWQEIGGQWYFFKPEGDMACYEWYDTYWLSASGAWTYEPRGSWHLNGSGWWFGDTSGWYAANTTIRIDDWYYTFNQDGYWVG